ncbi:MAG: hypothetical protein LBC84_07330 [Prevotellaceae bacterium]|jgi:hypothetical protein|nr:hypothetical protein [Prevotellaceae bacterium]
MKRILLFFCFVISFLSALFSQEHIDYGMFMNSAQDNSVLFRGVLPVNREKRSNDRTTYFAYYFDFVKGEIVYCGKKYKDVFLNLNALTDELYIKDSEFGIQQIVNKNFVDSFAMEKHRFVRLDPEKNSTLNSGYYEVLYTGKLWLYKKMQKQFYEIVYSRTNIKSGYTLLETFYLRKENTWYLVSSKADIRKLFPEHKKEINRYIRNQYLNFGDNKGLALIEIMNYIDSL